MFSVEECYERLVKIETLQFKIIENYLGPREVNKFRYQYAIEHFAYLNLEFGCDNRESLEFETKELMLNDLLDKIKKISNNFLENYQIEKDFLLEKKELIEKYQLILEGK